MYNQILSRSKPASEIRYGGSSTKKPAFPELEDYLLKRDYIGAITMLEVKYKIRNHIIIQYIH